MTIYYFHCMNFVAFFRANTAENQLAILFNPLIVERLTSIFRHQHGAVSNLTIAMANTA